MKKHPTDINSARGGTTDEKALLKSLRDKLDEAKRSIAAGDTGLTRAELRRRSRIRRSRARRK